MTDERGITVWNYDSFCIAWNYTEKLNNQSITSFFAALVTPWKINIEIIGNYKALNEIVTIQTNISYPCPYPFNNSQFSAEKSQGKITLPSFLKLMDNNSSVYLGTFKAGAFQVLTWKAIVIENRVNRGFIFANASGIIFGSVGEAAKTREETYPPYNYSDMIGGNGVLELL